MLVKPEPREEVERDTFDGSDGRERARRMASGIGTMVIRIFLLPRNFERY